MITHDFMEAYGGAERVTGEMARAFPDAPVVAILARPGVVRRMGLEGRLRTLLPPRERLLRHYRLLTPLYPVLTEAVRLPEADVVLSSSYAFAHRFRAPNGARHVCYCHSPIRFAWTVTDTYRDAWAGGRASGRAFELFAAAMRASDRKSSQRVAHYLTQSPYTVAQIERFYGRSADAIGAPVDCEVFRPSGKPPADYFLLCSRLFEPSKQSTFAIEAFRQLPHKLIVAGGGPALEQLRAMAPPNVELVGHVEDQQLVELMQGCIAALFPSRDAFGLNAVEAMACGRPVIAYGEGGALETVVPGLSGEFFYEQTSDAVAETVRAFESEGYDSDAIRRHAEQWDSRAFRERLVAAVDRVLGHPRETNGHVPVGLQAANGAGRNGASHHGPRLDAERPTLSDSAR